MGPVFTHWSSTGLKVRAVRTGRQALNPTCSSLSCVVLGSWFQRPAWDSDSGKGRALSSLLSSGTAPASTPQNLHAIRTDSGLILEWEEVIPEGPLEGPLGPYKLSWVQDNGTQVRGTQVRGDKLPFFRCTRVSSQGSKAFRASECPSLVGLGTLVGSASHHPRERESTFPHLPLQASSLLIGWCLQLGLHPVGGCFVCKAGSTFLHQLGRGGCR